MKKFIFSIDTSVSVFWSRVEKSCANDAKSLGAYRIIWAIFVCLFYMPNFSWLGHVPQGFFNPPPLSIAALFSGFPPWWVLQTTDIVIVVFVVLIGFGIKARLCSLVLPVIYLLISAFGYSFGKIDHGTLPWTILLCLSQTNWSTHYALLPDRVVSNQRANRALAVAGTLVGFAFFTAGFEKMIVWIDLDTFDERVSLVVLFGLLFVGSAIFSCTDCIACTRTHF